MKCILKDATLLDNEAATIQQHYLLTFWLKINRHVRCKNTTVIISDGGTYLYSLNTHMYIHLLALYLNITVKALTSARILFGLLYPQGQQYVKSEP